MLPIVSRVCCTLLLGKGKCSGIWHTAIYVEVCDLFSWNHRARSAINQARLDLVRKRDTGRKEATCSVVDVVVVDGYYMVHGVSTAD